VETERQLLDDIHGGNRQALKRLYERYVGYATAISLRYVPEREETRDVLQDSFVKILTSIDHFEYRGEGSLKSWVSRIVANRAIDHLKQQSRTTFLSEVAEEPEAPHICHDDDEPEVSDIPPDVLTAMIGQLPPGYRLVLNLYVFEQLSHKEIAQRLGIKPDTSASQFLRAKKRLAQMIKSYIKDQQI